MIVVDLENQNIQVKGNIIEVASEIAYLLDNIKKDINPPLAFFSSLFATFMTMSLNNDERVQLLKEIQIALNHNLK